MKLPRKNESNCAFSNADIYCSLIPVDNFEILSPMIDVIKIYGVFPLLVPETVIQKRIKFYHEYDILVSTGSTVTEYAIMENSFERYVTEAAKIGFDIIEIGENSIDMNLEQKQKVINGILSQNLISLESWKKRSKASTRCRQDVRKSRGIDENRRNQ
ncbi:MAG: phosphosulfolactate synthase [Nitrososphaeraceae archaeon]